MYRGKKRKVRKQSWNKQAYVWSALFRESSANLEVMPCSRRPFETAFGGERRASQNSSSDVVRGDEAECDGEEDSASSGGGRRLSESASESAIHEVADTFSITEGAT